MHCVTDNIITTFFIGETGQENGVVLKSICNILRKNKLLHNLDGYF